jgi:outer membrane protein assembly factor BamB
VALGLGANCRLKLAWQAPAGDEHELRSVPVVAAGVVWAGAGARVYALATADGRRLWDSGETLGNIAPAAPVPADGRLFVAAWDGRLHAYMAS